MPSPIATSSVLTTRHPLLAHYIADPWNGGTPPPDGAPLLHGYVAHGGELVSAAARRDIRASLPLLRVKVNALQEDSRPCEALRVDFLAGSGSTGPRSAALCRSVNEAAFALLYLIAETDLVPDDVPGIGYADDAAVLSAVLVRNERVLRDFARQIGEEWSALLPDTFAESAPQFSR